MNRCGRLLGWARLDGTTATLADPIGTALLACEVAVADPSAPADADFLLLPSADSLRFLDIAELRCLETVWGNLDEVTEQEGTDKQEWNQAKEGLRKRIQDKKKDLLDLYGYGGGAVAAGSLVLKYTEPEPDTELEDSEEWL